MIGEFGAYLADLDHELGPVPQHELRAAREWAAMPGQGLEPRPHPLSHQLRALPIFAVVIHVSTSRCGSVARMGRDA